LRVDFVYTLTMLSSGKTLGLVGAGSFGRECIPIAESMMAKLLSKNVQITNLIFVEIESIFSHVNSISVVSEDQFLNLPESKYFNITIADTIKRGFVASKFLSLGLTTLDLISPTCTVSKTAQLDIGAVVHNFAFISENSAIGRFFHCNYYSYVAHDCVIGDFVTFAPGVKCNGFVEIGNFAYIGAGAVIKEGSEGNMRKIGEGAIVGMGAIVLEDVPPYTVVAGNPARVIRHIPK